MLKKTLLANAVSLAVLCSATAAHANFGIENIQTMGYAKWGTLYTNNNDHNGGKGERNDVVRAGQGYGNYRLGNELNWWEAGVSMDLWRDGDTYFDTTLMLGSGEDWGDVSTIQMWSAGHGLFASQPDASVWIGERFYRRHEVHLADIKYWDTSSTGIGIENWNIGFGNAQIAWMSPDSSPDSRKDENGVEIDRRTLHNIDLRVSDIQLSDSADLVVGVNYVIAQNTKFKTEPGQNVTDSGYMLSTVYRQGWAHGNNTFAFQYGVDGLAGGLMSAEGGSDRKYSIGEDHDGHSWRVFNHGEVNVSKDVEIMYNVAYQDKRLDNKNGEKWFSIGARPQYQWSNTMATALEVGYESVKAQNGAGTNEMSKITLAQIFQAGKGVWARPSLRAFVTYARKTDEWDRFNGNGDTYRYGTATAIDKEKKNELIFGFNMETWW
ncbi:maltoporin [Endozoicomonas montiporae]|uniref:Maltoporin n=2 Tax=Endozoicomonas montiporae TaxID=1027273 RepID=A0A081N227_9GAMM|nr:carbohydrate porin [Endozoicomonas montiporae]AMO58547.1 maltoporin [Endozoicomonas montiporae CL-33]KEQ12500.1 maltoporin [Endozoicomonas montiporae]